MEQHHLQWSSQFVVAPSQHTPKLPGDKIVLPQSALEQLLAAAPIQEISSRRPSQPHSSTFDPFNPYTFAAESYARERTLNRQQQLPHPLTFRIVNPKNGRVIYAGIREFSARDNEIGLSGALREALDIRDAQRLPEGDGGSGAENEGGTAPIVTVHAKQLPKGTYVRLRPLEAGYDPEDWKALLERHLRDNYTTLTTGEVLTVPGGQQDPSFRFLLDRVEPEGEGICVVDTDLEVDIVALNEDQARETLRKRLEKASSRAPATQGGTSVGGVLKLGAEVAGQVLPGDYVDYELQEWAEGSTIDIILEGGDDADVSLLLNPLSARQRNRPRQDEFVFGELSGPAEKQIRIAPTNVELEGAEALYISIYAWPAGSPEQTVSQQSLPLPYRLRIGSGLAASAKEDPEYSLDEHDPDDAQCKNCHRWVTQRTFVLHETFCFRNNILCTQCNNVFQKRSPEWENHWHCPHDISYGNDPSSKSKHDAIFHSKRSCSACGFEADGLQRLAQHRTTACPAKPILCPTLRAHSARTS
ncbi:ubiquitin fusion degradation protein UFD1-domain-containing protein [Aspergillus heterothallicus]